MSLLLGRENQDEIRATREAFKGSCQKAWGQVKPWSRSILAFFQAWYTWLNSSVAPCKTRMPHMQYSPFRGLHMFQPTTESCSTADGYSPPSAFSAALASGNPLPTICPRKHEPSGAWDLQTRNLNPATAASLGIGTVLLATDVTSGSRHPQESCRRPYPGP